MLALYARWGVAVAQVFVCCRRGGEVGPRGDGVGYTQVSSHIRDRQLSIGIAVPVYSGQK
jgi:hypothetical protein